MLGLGLSLCVCISIIPAAGMLGIQPLARRPPPGGDESMPASALLPILAWGRDAFLHFACICLRLQLAKAKVTSLPPTLGNCYIPPAVLSGLPPLGIGWNRLHPSPCIVECCALAAPPALKSPPSRFRELNEARDRPNNLHNPRISVVSCHIH